jgi:predicted helicase
VVIAQSSVSAGYELPSFPCVVFASLSGSLVDLEQAKGRVQRLGKLKKNLYVFMVVKGGVDEARYKANIDKQDFFEHLFLRGLQ